MQYLHISLLSFLPLVALSGLLALPTVAGQDAFECRSGVGWTKDTMGEYDSHDILDLNAFYITKFYDLTWNCADLTYPVSIFWFAGAGGAGSYNATKYFAVHNITNASSGTFQFNPNRITQNGSSSPPRNSNMTGDEILSRAISDLNYLVIAQPDRPGYERMMHFLGPFLLLPQRAQDLFMAEYSAGRKKERKRWIIGVAVAVPLGLLIVAAMSFWLGRKAKGRGTEKKGWAGRHRKPILGVH